MGCWCSNRKKIIGNIVFKPIQDKLLKTGKKELDDLFINAEKSLKKAESLRINLAEKFKTMIIETGVCVLRNPTIERVIISFLVLILVNIYKESHKDYQKIQTIEYSKIFLYKKEAPFLSLNDETMKSIKETLNLDILENKNIIASKNAIFDFLGCLLDMKEWFRFAKNEIEEIYHISYAYVNKIKEDLMNSDKEGITFKQAKNYLAIGEKNLEQIFGITQLISTVTLFLFDTMNAVKSLENILCFGELERVKKVAKDALEKNIIDPKHIVYYYSKYEKCKSVEDWEENLCYMEVEDNELYF
jgi:hypothetical protein